MEEISSAQPRYCQLFLTAPTVGEIGVAQEVGVVVGVVDEDVVVEGFVVVIIVEKRVTDTIVLVGVEDDAIELR